MSFDKKVTELEHKHPELSKNNLKIMIQNYVKQNYVNATGCITTETHINTSVYGKVLQY